ncbi:MAG: S8 family serine peptidase [Bacteroidales bacterium]|nr:S8 family serine peptidase [Bacteroidales bacterium]
MAVAALDSTDKLADFSNYGTWVDISAPGTEIMSTVTNNEYGKMSGTSMACPQVSGVAALIVSQFKNSGITPDQVRNRIQGLADDIDDKNPLFKHKLGAGRINAFKALHDAGTIPPSAITNLQAISSEQLSVTIAWTTPLSRISDSINTISQYECRYSNMPITADNFENATEFDLFKPSKNTISDTAIITGLQSDTVYYIAIKTIDAFSNKSTLSNIATIRTSRAPKAVFSQTEVNLSMQPSQDSLIHITITNAGKDTLTINQHYQNETAISDKYLQSANSQTANQPVILVVDNRDSTMFKLVEMNPFNGKIYSSRQLPLGEDLDYPTMAIAYDGNFIYINKSKFSKKGYILVFDKQLQLLDSIPAPHTMIVNDIAVNNGKVYILDNWEPYLTELDIRTKTVSQLIKHRVEYGWG